jgi:outer membrane protein TolC
VARPGPKPTGALRWRLFDFGKVDAEVDSARSADAEVLASYRQSVLRAAEDSRTRSSD